MQATGTFLLVWVLSVLGLGVFTSDNVLANSAAPVNVPFERIKSLAGNWDMRGRDGKLVTEAVEVVSAERTVIFRMKATKEDMVTIFHPDEDTVIGTHYCDATNQPRFALKSSSEPNALAFDFKDATNLSSPEAGHMQSLIIRFKDADHHTEQWTWRENGKDTVETMEFTRRK